MAYRHQRDGPAQLEGESWFALFAPAGTPGRSSPPAQRARRDHRDAEFAGRVERAAAGCWRSPERHIKFLQEESSAGRSRDPIRRDGRLNHLVRAQQQVRRHDEVEGFYGLCG